MFGLDTLDVGVGMILMFLFMSIIASAVRELGELLLKTRATSLERGIREMLGEGATVSRAMTERFYNHASISALFQGTYASAKPGRRMSFIPGFGRNGLPSYIPSENFAQTVLQLARDDAGIASNLQLGAAALRNWAASNPPTRLQQAVRTALDVAGDDLAKTQEALGHWFDSTMDRVSGWYKRRTQIWLFTIGFVAAAVMNIDAITIMQRLSTDDKLRAQVVATAGTMIAKCADKANQCNISDDDTAGNSTDIDTQFDHIKAATAQMTVVNWPIGWDGHRPDPQYRLITARQETVYSFYGWKSGPEPDLMWWLAILGGWMVTAFGVSFGAAFWFDLLNKVMVVRSTIKPDEKSPKEKSKS